MKRFLTSVAVVAFVGIVMSGCGSNDDKKDATPTTGGSTAATITLVATDFKFDQTALTAAADKPVTLVIKNEGKAEHNLSIEKLQVNKDAEAGESAKQTVTPAAGTYEYHCEYHPTQMTGTLTVS